MNSNHYFGSTSSTTSNSNTSIATTTETDSGTISLANIDSTLSINSGGLTSWTLNPNFNTYTITAGTGSTVWYNGHSGDPIPWASPYITAAKNTAVDLNRREILSQIYKNAAEFATLVIKKDSTGESIRAAAGHTIGFIVALADRYA